MSRVSDPYVKQHPNGRYYIHWTDGRRSKRISTSATTLRGARAALAQWLALEQDQAAKAVVRTCGDAWPYYSFRDHTTRKAAWRERLEPFFGGTKIAEITDQDIEGYVRKHRPKYAQGTLWQDINYLVASWHAAEKAKRLPSSEIPKVKRPDAPRPRERWLRDDEITALLTAADQDLDAHGRLSRGARFIYLALETTARRRAIEGCRWSHVDFSDGGAILIDYTAGAVRAGQKRRAVVPVSARLRPILMRMHAERTSDFLLDRPTYITRDVDRIVKKAGLGKDVTPHTFRHTAATHMVRRGVPLALAAKVLGNTAQVVEQTYAKHIPDWLQGAVDAISGSGADGALRTT